MQHLCGGLTEGCSHGWVLHGGLAVSGGQVRPGEVAALLVVVFDVEAGEFREANPQSAAAVIDVLSVQRLKQTHRLTKAFSKTGFLSHVRLAAHQFSCLGRCSIWILQQSLELTVLSEDDDPQHCAEL